MPSEPDALVQTRKFLFRFMGLVAQVRLRQGEDFKDLAKEERLSDGLGDLGAYLAAIGRARPALDLFFFHDSGAAALIVPGQGPAKWPRFPGLKEAFLKALQSKGIESLRIDSRAGAEELGLLVGFVAGLVGDLSRAARMVQLNHVRTEILQEGEKVVTSLDETATQEFLGGRSVAEKRKEGEKPSFEAGRPAVESEARQMRTLFQSVVSEFRQSRETERRRIQELENELADVREEIEETRTQGQDAASLREEVERVGQELARLEPFGPLDAFALRNGIPPSELAGVIEGSNRDPAARERVLAALGLGTTAPPANPAADEAPMAPEIAKLREENERLRKVLSFARRSEGEPIDLASIAEVLQSSPDAIEWLPTDRSSLLLLRQVEELGTDGAELLRSALARAAAQPDFYRALVENMDKFDCQEALLKLQHLHRVSLVDRENLLQAERIQQCVLPASLPRVPGFELAVSCRLSQGVGGDYYDVLTLGGGMTAMIVADVAGKGIAAALFLMGFRRILREAAARASGAEDLLDELNREVAAENHRMRSSGGEASLPMHVTAALACVDAVQGLVTLSCAGQPPALLVSGPSVFPARSSGQSLGWNRVDFQARLLTQTVKLTPDLRILLYTDGVTDAESAEGERFGMQRAIEVLARHGEEPVGTIVSRLREAIDGFADPSSPTDDLVILGLAPVGEG
ncbi:MAG: SpoIIE family protein phosphatase [Planctomycetes bacterium]|nr:SpoIIE family protein phosphatase [Planctomycetota bacterium]